MSDLSKRSQAVRTRHQERSRKRTVRAAETSRHPVSSPPILSRKETGGKIPHHKANGKVRRQYYYALSSPGAEVRLPAMPQIHPGWRMLSGGLVILLLVGLIALWSAPTFRLGNFKLVGAQRILASDIEAVLRVSNLPVFLADVVKMEDTLAEAFPDLLDVRVQIGFPSSMVISLTEREPVLIWEQDGKTQWIDAQGYAFPARGEPQSDLVTVIAEGATQEKTAKSVSILSTEEANAVPSELIHESKEPKPFIPAELIQPIMDMTTMAPQDVPIAYHPRYGLGWSDPQGWKVYFGQQMTDMSLKLQEYQAIYDYVTANNIHPSFISVEFPHAPYYRMEP